jgi:hypothetical protein
MKFLNILHKVNGFFADTAESYSKEGKGKLILLYPLLLLAFIVLAMAIDSTILLFTRSPNLTLTFDAIVDIVQPICVWTLYHCVISCIKEIQSAREKKKV